MLLSLYGPFLQAAGFVRSCSYERVMNFGDREKSRELVVSEVPGSLRCSTWPCAYLVLSRIATPTTRLHRSRGREAHLSPLEFHCGIDVWQMVTG